MKTFPTRSFTLIFAIGWLLPANLSPEFCSAEWLTQDQVQEEDSLPPAVGDKTADDAQDESKGVDQQQSNGQDDEKVDGESKDKAKNDSRDGAKDDAKDDTNDDAKAKGNDRQAKSDETPARAQRRVRPPRNRDPQKEVSKRSSEIEAMLRPLVASAEASMVKVLSGDRLVSLGMVVDRNGLILTKASELKTELSCELPDGSQLPATVFGIDDSTDLAILKVNADNLLPIHWGSEEIPILGQWVVAPTFEEQYPLQVGVVAVEARKIPSSGSFLGISGAVAPQEGVVGAKIDMVQPNTPADEANLMVGDIITAVDEVEIKNWADLPKALGQYDPKDEVELTIQRGDEELKIQVTLGDREKLETQDMSLPQFDRSNLQNRMGSRPSQRRKDFPLAFQTDLMLDRATCGGPLLNLDGQVVGINIARAGRVDSLALPVSVLLPVVEKLKTGDFAPEIVHRARIDQIDVELQEMASQRIELPKRQNKLENRNRIETARLEEIERSKQEMAKAIEELEKARQELAKGMEELEKRIQVIEKKSGMYQKEIDSITSQQKRFERRQQSLERERERLKLGVN